MLETHINYPTDPGLVHQVVKTLTRSARKTGQKITSHVRSTKRALARMGAVLKSNNKDGKRQIEKTLKRVSHLAKTRLSSSAPPYQRFAKGRTLS